MHSTTLFGIFAVAAASASLTACGSDTSTAGAGGSTTTATATATTTSGASTTSTSGTGGAPALINGCDPTALEDHTADATVNIKFGDTAGLTYSPPCIKVKSGTMVTFTGDFATHPLAPGKVTAGSTPPVDDKSPIKATSGAAPSASFAIAPAGSYPYYCTVHYSVGMEGLIVAE